MRVNGYGEFQQMRRAADKETAAGQTSRAKNGAAPAQAAKAEAGDQVTFSPEARRMARLRAMPEMRQEAVEQARSALANGQASDAEAVRRATTQFLQDAFGR